MNTDSPFGDKSAKTPRSPIQTRAATGQAKVHITQTTTPIAKPQVSTENRDQLQKNTPSTQTTDIETDHETQRNTNKPVQTSIKATNTNEMNQKDIQVSITSMVPEFSGTDTQNRKNELDRFVGTADIIYDTLTTEAEQRIFNKLIKFRLTGDAFNRINRRQIQTYVELKDALKGMYLNVETIDTLEQNFVNCRQSYGETIRNYGYRLIEALERYKDGYRTKYNARHIDDTYEKHLDDTAVKTFKRGLNHIILREKIATYKTNKVTDIIDETELYEKMLEASTNTYPQQNSHTDRPHRTQTNYMTTRITCNYCQRQNHTWDECRTRMFAERRTTNFQSQPQRSQYNQNNQAYPQNLANQSNFRQSTANNHTQMRLPTNGMPQYKPTQNQSFLPQTNNPNSYPSQQQNFSNFRQQYRNNYRDHQPEPNPIFNTYRQQRNSDFQPWQPKHCSFCKTTTGHTFDECRSKFLRPQQTRTDNPNAQQHNTSNNSLEDNFKNMRINATFHQNEKEHNQGNEDGSNQ